MKKSWILILLLVFVAVSLGLVFVSTQRFPIIESLPTAITTPFEFLQPKKTTTSDVIPSNSQPATIRITKTPLKDSSVMYQVEGYFEKDLEFKFGSLYGEFIIQGLPSHKPIPVFLSGEKGQMQFGQTQEDETAWATTKSTQIRDLVKAKTPVELRIVASKEDQQSINSGKNLEDILQTKRIPINTIFVPQMIRIL